MKLVKQLTEIYIAAIRRPKYSRLPDTLMEQLRDALIGAQCLLNVVERERYTKWHKKRWPNLDW